MKEAAIVASLLTYCQMLQLDDFCLSDLKRSFSEHSASGSLLRQLFLK
jgi:hypothetical protein